MVRAFVFLAGLPVLPFRSTDRIDIVPVDYVAESIVTLHQKPNPAARDLPSLFGHGVRNVWPAHARAGAKPPGKWSRCTGRGSSGNFSSVVNWLSNYREARLAAARRCLKVFMPYLVWDTVFDNSRVVAEMGRAPEPFSKYCYPLLRFSRDHHFSYPYEPWPGSAGRGPRRRRGRRSSGSARGISPMMDLVLEAWTSSLHRALRRALEIRRGASLAAGRKTEAALCRIQRHAQHGLGRARRGNAAAGAARAGRGKSRAQRDVPESGLEPRLFRRRAPGASCRISTRRFCSAKCGRSTA